MILAEAVALTVLVVLVLYTLTGGADFGGGIWDLLATGPRRVEQRRLIEQAIAPVWEANHVWLIVAIVLIFTAFPLAFSVASTALHIPLIILLIGIVMRGTPFTFRQYDLNRESRGKWSRLFAGSSVLVPLFLGICLGSLSTETIRVANTASISGFFSPWIGWFQLSVGFFTLSLFAYIAAVYLTVEAKESAIRADFVRRSYLSAISLVFTGFVTALLARSQAPHLFERLTQSWGPWFQVSGALCLFTCAWSLLRERFRFARVFAAGVAISILAGWGYAQYPYSIIPDIPLNLGTAPEATLRLLLILLAGGSAFLFPALFWLFKIFKKY